MMHKYSTRLTALALVAATFFFLGHNTSAHRRSPATRVWETQQSGQGVEGFWLGTLDAGVAKLRLMMKFSRTPDGKLKGLLDSCAVGGA